MNELRPVRELNGKPWNGQLRKFSKGDSDKTLFQGDPTPTDKWRLGSGAIITFQKSNDIDKFQGSENPILMFPVDDEEKSNER